MAFKNAEQELREFLAALPSWARKVLQHNFPLDPEESEALQNAFEIDTYKELIGWQEEYRSILRRIPAQWREYREKLRQIALRNVPSGKPGRPRKDEEREQLKKKYQEGKSYTQIAIARLPVQRTDDPEVRAQQQLVIKQEADRIRKLVGPRKPSKPGSAPDKT